MRCQGWSARGSGSVERRPAPPEVRRSRISVSRRSIARANRSLGVISDAESLSDDAAALAGRCLVGSGRATGANVLPFTFTGPPHKGHRQMLSLPIPAFPEHQIACHSEAAGGDCGMFQIGAIGRNRLTTRTLPLDNRDETDYSRSR